MADLLWRPSALVASRCPFCKHNNPGGAKFCNDCGSPLHLKPCSRCDAVNDLADEHCRECGTELPTSSTGTGPVARSDREATGAASSSKDVGSVRTRPPLPESLVEALSAFGYVSREQTAGAAHLSAVSADSETTVLRGPVTIPRGSLQNAGSGLLPSRPAPLTVPHRRPRAAWVATLVVVVAASAAYLYRDSLPVKDWLGAGAPHPSAATDRSSAPPARITVTPSSSPAGNGAGVAAAESAANDGGSSAITGTTAPGTASDERPSTLGTVNEDVSTRPGSPPAGAGERTPIGASAITPNAARETKRAAPSRMGAAQTSSRRSATPPVAAGEAILRPRSPESAPDRAREGPRVGACTEAIAALGFCKVDSDRGERK